MIAPLLAIGCAAGLVTFAGGKLALRFQDRLHLLLGFSAGAVIGVALFDLLPEAIETSRKFHELPVVTGIVALGFVAYMFADRMFSATRRRAAVAEVPENAGGQRGHLGAGSLTLHSLLDGVGIGLAFQISVALGTIMAVAVLVHDFSDGINTVQLSLFGGATQRHAARWLLADALAPIAGIAGTFLFRMPESAFGLVLALFAGFFLYIGASELLPESHHRHPQLWTSGTTAAGIGVIYMAVHFAKL